MIEALVLVVAAAVAAAQTNAPLPLQGALNSALQQQNGTQNSSSDVLNKPIPLVVIAPVPLNGQLNSSAPSRVVDTPSSIFNVSGVNQSANASANGTNLSSVPAATANTTNATTTTNITAPVPVPAAMYVTFCGGYLGIKCSSTHWCELPDGAVCGEFPYVMGRCRERPSGEEVCTTDYNPVCGCDGVTHSNRCAATRAAVNVRHAGPCLPHPQLNTSFIPNGTANATLPPYGTINATTPSNVTGATNTSALAGPTVNATTANGSANTTDQDGVPEHGHGTMEMSTSGHDDVDDTNANNTRKRDGSDDHDSADHDDDDCEGECSVNATSCPHGVDDECHDMADGDHDRDKITKDATSNHNVSVPMNGTSVSAEKVDVEVETQHRNDDHNHGDGTNGHDSSSNDKDDTDENDTSDNSDDPIAEHVITYPITHDPTAPATTHHVPLPGSYPVYNSTSGTVAMHNASQLNATGLGAGIMNGAANALGAAFNATSNALGTAMNATSNALGAAVNATSNALGSAQNATAPYMNATAAGVTSGFAGANSTNATAGWISNGTVNTTAPITTGTGDWLVGADGSYCDGGSGVRCGEGFYCFHRHTTAGTILHGDDEWDRPVAHMQGGADQSTVTSSRKAKVATSSKRTAYTAGVCGRDGSMGVCKTMPTACALQYEPVCGCDGRDYSSPCAAAATGINVASDGVCADPAAVPPVTTGVTTSPRGSAGGTDAGVHEHDSRHPDEHLYEFDLTQPGVDGACGLTTGVDCARHTGARPIWTGREYCRFPVGGCGRTTGGECRIAAISCPPSSTLLCGCDGVTYGSACQAASRKVSIRHLGECGSAEVPVNVSTMQTGDVRSERVVSRALDPRNESNEKASADDADARKAVTCVAGGKLERVVGNPVVAETLATAAALASREAQSQSSLHSSSKRALVDQLAAVDGLFDSPAITSAFVQFTTRRIEVSERDDIRGAILTIAKASGVDDATVMLTDVDIPAPHAASTNDSANQSADTDQAVIDSVGDVVIAQGDGCGGPVTIITVDVPAQDGRPHAAADFAYDLMDIVLLPMLSGSAAGDDSMEYGGEMSNDETTSDDSKPQRTLLFKTLTFEGRDGAVVAVRAGRGYVLPSNVDAGAAAAPHIVLADPDLVALDTIRRSLRIAIARINGAFEESSNVETIPMKANSEASVAVDGTHILGGPSDIDNVHSPGTHLLGGESDPDNANYVAHNQGPAMPVYAPSAPRVFAEPSHVISDEKPPRVGPTDDDDDDDELVSAHPSGHADAPHSVGERLQSTFFGGRTMQSPFVRWGILVGGSLVLALIVLAVIVFLCITVKRLLQSYDARRRWAANRQQHRVSKADPTHYYHNHIHNNGNPPESSISVAVGDDNVNGWDSSAVNTRVTAPLGNGLASGSLDSATINLGRSRGASPNLPSSAGGLRDEFVNPKDKDFAKFL